MKHKRTLKITSRTSSVTNGFVQAILPDIPPTADERAKLLASLELDEENIDCVYCGDTATDWDHLRPLVRGKRPTGYLTDFRNLVPSCGPCNQSKGGQDWQAWMNGPAIKSPRSRAVADFQERFNRLLDHESRFGTEPIDFSQMVGSVLWDTYWQRLVVIEALMKEAQIDAQIIRAKLSEATSFGSLNRQTGDAS